MNSRNHHRICAFIDLDGTMYHGSTKVEGADRLIATLQELQVPYLFVTNNSSRTPEDVAKLLQGFGIPANPQDVLTSAQAAASYIQMKHSDKLVFMVGEQGLQQALTEAGIRWTDDVNEVWEQCIGVVVQGIDHQFSYAKLEAASCAIRKGAVSILTNPDVMLPSDRGFSPGAGTIGAAVQAASGVEPIIIGKPSELIMKVALERMQCEAADAIVVGDNMMTDMLAGVNAGCRTALVFTGLTTPSNLDEYKERSGVIPDVVCHDMEEMRQWFIDAVNQQ
ncbi:HAD-IIA family hydrolase [Paenibacillus profundus]|uniref:Acid sugar phosphatase n=1 Tax=Paenibacillus profundus TaxID=1173085 RepID=A0ABS8YJU4_9BACL|nr:MULTISPECIES: HAD-IIA family hydrolase [Paenibacillus]MCE5172081.1 HAD-IIA family hydrolase [Paenibacillus profundus]